MGHVPSHRLRSPVVTRIVPGLLESQLLRTYVLPHLSPVSPIRAIALLADIGLPGLCLHSCASQLAHLRIRSPGLLESQLLRTTCSRTCRRYPQSGLSPYLRISACPAYVCTAVQASLPICASAVRGFQRYIISGSFLVNNRKLASFLYSRGLISSSMVLRSLAMH